MDSEGIQTTGLQDWKFHFDSREVHVLLLADVNVIHDLLQEWAASLSLLLYY